MGECSIVFSTRGDGLNHPTLPLLIRDFKAKVFVSLVTSHRTTDKLAVSRYFIYNTMAAKSLERSRSTFEPAASAPSSSQSSIDSRAWFGSIWEKLVVYCESQTDIKVRILQREKDADKFLFVLEGLCFRRRPRRIKQGDWSSLE